MTAIVSPSNDEPLAFVARHRDKRLGLGDLLMAVTRALGDRTDASLMRGAFEEMLRRIVPVRSASPRQQQQMGRSWGTLHGRRVRRAGGSRIGSRFRGRSRDDIRAWLTSRRLGFPDPWHRVSHRRLGPRNRTGPSGARPSRPGGGNEAEARRRRAINRFHAGHAGAAVRNRACSHDRFHRAARRRKRSGQGTCRASDPRIEPPPERAICGNQLRSIGGNTCRGRALWDRRPYGDGRSRSPRKVRACRWRDAVS